MSFIELKESLFLIEETYERKNYIEKIYENTINNVYYYINFDNNFNVNIAIRGSNNKSNWIDNLMYFKTFDKGLEIYIHFGIKKLFNAIYDDLMKIIKQYKNYKLNFFGHSLGGSIAILLFLKFKKNGFNSNKVITFGSPKFTNFNGAEKYNIDGITRVINDKDIVNLLPSSSFISRLFGEYRHFGKEIILNDDFTYDINEKEKVITKNKTLLKNIDFKSVSEHRIKDYKKKILFLIEEKFANHFEV